ncbi:MAG: hypothetical protein GX657_06305 [Chloroflexi bacterium]|nr:hypothetical protein [Chloroflexota bacterium]
MAKKRSRKGNVRAARGAVARQATPVRSAPTRPATPPAEAKAERGSAVDFAAEYHCVVDDLKRIGILAAAMFATLVALALIIG